MPIDADFEMEYNGLILNDYGVSPPAYPLMTIEGLDSPEVRVADIDRVMEDGGFTYGRFSKTRKITLGGEVLAADATGLDTAMDSLKAAFATQATDLPLRFRRPGGALRRVYCKPSRGPAYPIDPQYAIGNGVFAVELVAGDPRIYDDTQSSQVIAAGATAVLNNAGNWPTYPVVTFDVTAAIAALEIKNDTTGERLVLAGSYVNGDDVVVDFANKTIKKNDVSNYADLNQTLSTWWDLNAGNQTIRAVGASFNATVVWRSAWR